MLSTIVLLSLAPQAGAISLQLDATDIGRNVVRVRESIPARGGKMAISLPRYIPGDYDSAGLLHDVANFFVYADGKTIAWKRRTSDLNTVDLEVPTGAKSIELTFDCLLQPGDMASSQLARIKWNRFVFLPDTPMQRQMVRAEITPPAGWLTHTALPVEQTGRTVRFQAVTAERLVDSPAQIGQYGTTLSLGNGYSADLLATSPDLLTVPQSYIEAWRRLGDETEALFAGSKPFKTYRYLVTLSDHAAREGLEHTDSTEMGVATPAFTTDFGFGRITFGELAAHELFHSWNGKKRRPAGLITDTFQGIPDYELLWVYEGLTEYYGMVLAARSGFMSPEEFREWAAVACAVQTSRTGRAWRSIADTAVAVTSVSTAPQGWRAARRGGDFYEDTMFVWLEADAIIRQGTKGAKSLDDFCREFVGPHGADFRVLPYRYTDVVAALRKVHTFDWDGFLRNRIYAPGPPSPAERLERSGWRLVHNAKNSVLVAMATTRGVGYRHWDLGLAVQDSGQITDCIIGSPGYLAGCEPGVSVQEVNGEKFSQATLVKAIEDAAKTRKPIRLGIKKEGAVRELEIPYFEGVRWPGFERIAGHPDTLAEILRPRAAAGTGK